MVVPEKRNFQHITCCLPVKPQVLKSACKEGCLFRFWFGIILGYAWFLADKACRGEALNELVK